MSLRAQIRPLAICLVVVAALTLAACSGDDDGGDAGPAATGGGRASRTAYCDAISSAYDLAQQHAAGSAPSDLPDRFAEQLARAASVAPNEVIVDYMQALRGDVYAQDDFDEYNETTCGVDTGSLREQPSTSTAE